jgi:hypothetical protein
MNLMDANPLLLLIIGFVLVLVGAAIPWLIVLRFIESTFFLNFLSFGSTVSGLLIGIIGTAGFVRGRRK